MLSSTCFEHPNVHPQEDLYMKFDAIYFMHPYKQSEDEHLDIRNMSKTL